MNVQNKRTKTETKNYLKEYTDSHLKENKEKSQGSRNLRHETIENNQNVSRDGHREFHNDG